MSFKLGRMELGRKTVVLAVSDIDRAKAFYAGLGWRIDVDVVSGHDRIVRLTPAGSDASIVFGTGLTAVTSHEPLVLVVDDIAAAREALSARGADVGDDHFQDPDGNVWRLSPAG